MSSSSPTRARRRLTLAAGVLAAISLLATACITNAGTFALDILSGSSFTVRNAAGEPTLSFPYGDTPACADGVDNDLDTRIDTADAQCDNTTDNNERLDGVQVAAPPELPLRITALDEVFAEPTQLTFPQLEICVDLGLFGGISCLGVTLHGSGGEQKGLIDADTKVMTLTLPLVVELDALVGFGGLGSNCRIGPINATFVSEPYDTVGGRAVLNATDVAVAAVDNCGDLYNPYINAIAGLPGTADFTLQTTILNADGEPIDFYEPAD